AVRSVAIGPGPHRGAGTSRRQPNRGTSVDVGQRARDRPDRSDGDWGMTARLAIVDDDAAFTGYLQTLLGAQGYDVEVFNSGTSLLDGLRSGVAPNVVLLDVL